MHLRSKTHYGEKALIAGYQFIKTIFCCRSPADLPPQNTIDSTEEKSRTISYENYKINYSRCLGRGTFGCVYEISPRPEDEKGRLSSTFPYAYDYLHPTPASIPSSTAYCVKILKTSPRICLEYIKKPHKALMYPIASFFNHALEKKLHCLLIKYGLSEMDFIKTKGVYSQFKTRINGDTFGFYVENNYFLMKDQFQFRKSFVEFLRSVIKAPLIFYDMYAANVMYDTKKERWEIIDGIAREATDKNHTNKHFLADLTRKAKINDASRQILTDLNILADLDRPYTIADDQSLLEKANIQLPLNSLRPV